MAACAFNPSLRDADTKWIPEMEATLIYRANSTTNMATQRNPVSENKPTAKRDQ